MVVEDIATFFSNCWNWIITIFKCNDVKIFAGLTYWQIFIGGVAIAIIWKIFSFFFLDGLFSDFRGSGYDRIKEVKTANKPITSYTSRRYQDRNGNNHVTRTTTTKWHDKQGRNYTHNEIRND